MAAQRSGTGLSAWLAGRTDGELAALLAARPDLLHPVPADVARLANAATSRGSLQLAVDRLDTLALQVLRALAAADGAMTYAELAAALRAPEAQLRATVDLLRERALCFGADDALTTSRQLRQIPLLPAENGPSISVALENLPPQRLRPLLTDAGAGDVHPHQALYELGKRFADPGMVRTLLGQVSPQAREALDRVAESHGRGKVENAQRAVTASTARSPIDELLARALLVAMSAETVVIPFEVAAALDQAYREPPAVEAPVRDRGLVDATGGLHAHGFVQAVEDLLDEWADRPPARLRTGGLGVRDLRRAADLLDVDSDHAALVVEAAYVAGLVDATYPEEEWLPTTAYDGWRAQPVEARWVALARAWSGTPRSAGLVGQKDEKGKTRNALGSEVLHGGAANVRQSVLDELAGLEPGAAPSTENLVHRLAWDRPRSGGTWRRQLAEWSAREAEWLGVTGQGALTAYGRSLVTRDDERAARLLAEVLPELVSEVLLQPDLTAVAPGPLRPDVRAELSLLADVESTGGATVYRFGPDSVRRALDAGRTAAEVRDWLAAHSRTGVPQPLLYLVDDLARKHGRLRAGAANSYLRSDDGAALTEILAHRRAVDLAMRRIAPTVVVSQLGRAELLDGLRRLGYAPVAESATGDVVVTTRRSRRSHQQRRVWQPAAFGAERPSDHLVEQAVRMLRAGERLARDRRPDQRSEHDPPAGALPRNPHGETLTAVQRAVAGARPLWIGYVDDDGRASLRLVEPEAVLGGLVKAYDHLREARRTFALHRITGYATVDDD